VRSEQNAFIVENIMHMDEKNVISEATIEMINDLLKKYEKEFTFFTSNYELELQKTRALKIGSHEKADKEMVLKVMEDKIKRVDDILA